MTKNAFYSPEIPANFRNLPTCLVDLTVLRADLTDFFTQLVFSQISLYWHEGWNETRPCVTNAVLGFTAAVWALMRLPDILNAAEKTKV